ncbi:MAG: M48 family metallopeptidase [Maricaulaceae bacterium]
MCDHHDDMQNQGGAKVAPEIKSMHERRAVVQALAAGGAITVMGAGATGCATNPETGAKQFKGLIGSKQLDGMALSSWNEMRQKMPTSNDPRYTRRLKNVGARVARGAGRADQKWDYEVFDQDTKNAFVLPGNRVGFYKGMMDFADNDDQIAAIMGHEVGHVAGEHALERVNQQLGGQLLIGGASILGGVMMGRKCNQATSAAERNNCNRQTAQNTKKLNTALGLGFTFGVILPYSRKHELQSDLLGAKYMHKSGYEPQQAVKLWEKMAKNSPSRQPEFMSTHPDPARRARQLHDYISYQEKLGSQGWQSIAMPKSS